MTDEEFEDAYREALLCLGEVGHRVAEPEIVNASRVCVVDGKPLNDYQVLNLFWGKEIVEEIRRSRRAQLGGKSHNVGSKLEAHEGEC